jgi:hypothetical protein
MIHHQRLTACGALVGRGMHKMGQKTKEEGGKMEIQS